MRTMQKRFSMFVLLMFVTLPFLAWGDTAVNTPEGLWKTIDDKTNKPKSIVRVWQEDGKLKGKIIKLFREPDEEQNPKCDKCKGDKKDKPVLGMIFLWGFTGKGDFWKKGKILDPKNGKIYHCQLKVKENGKKLHVYGYIRIIFKIGRSQTWLRASEADLEQKEKTT